MNKKNSIDNSWGKSPDSKEIEKSGREKLLVGRIIKVSRGQYLVATEEAIFRAEVSGAFRYKTVLQSDYPAVGDWVAFKKSSKNDIDNSFVIIEWIFNRKSCLSRKIAGNTTNEQIIAANIDVIFLVFAINGGRNFTQAGLERYLTIAWDSGALPMVILNKIDLCSEEEKEKALFLAENAAPGVEIKLVSAETKLGLNSLLTNLAPKTTIALIGPSGVGKSSLINALKGNNTQKTASQRESDLRGRHTTTHRELFRLSSGLLLIDNPGMRELQLWGDSESADETFSDIVEIAGSCRFSDCSHQEEPGCAVQKALSDGSLDQRRFENYLELKRELDYLHRRQTGAATGKNQKKMKDISKQIKEYYKGNFKAH